MDQELSLTQCRRALSLTQSELAEKWGVDIATIWRWENRGVPKRGAAQKLVSDLAQQIASSEVAA